MLDTTNNGGAVFSIAKNKGIDKLRAAREYLTNHELINEKLVRCRISYINLMTI